jgi:hypothetical protein
VSALCLSAVLDRPVVTDGGRQLGRAFDLRARWTDDGLVLDALVVGRHGLLERYGLRRLRWSGTRREPDVIPCTAMLDLDGPDGTIVVSEAELAQHVQAQNA